MRSGFLNTVLGLRIAALFVGEWNRQDNGSRGSCHDHGLNLLRVDLSTVVNKYIGVTEKNYIGYLTQLKGEARSCF